MSEILHTDTTKISKWGNSLGIRIKQIYTELAGMDKENTEITQAVIQGKHGIYIAHWLPEEQPQLKDIPEEKLEKLLEDRK